MATAAEVIERLAPLTGLLPSTLDRQTRAQRLADQLPTAGHGGGRYRSRHYDARHLTAVLLGLAGAQPSDAPEAFVALRSIPHRGTQNPQPDAAEPLPQLEDMLAYWIEYIAAEIGEGHSANDPGFALIRSMKLGLCLNPRQAIITIGPDGPGQTTIVYATGPELPLSLRRSTILSGDLLMAAGELLADTIEQRNAVECMKFLAETQPAKAGAGQENAGNLRQEVPGAIRDQPRANETDRDASTSERIGEKKEFQAAAGHSSETAGVDHERRPDSADASVEGVTSCWL